MNTRIFALSLALTTFGIACDDDDDDDNPTSASAGDDGGGDDGGTVGGGDGGGGGQNTSSSETCDSRHECINDACQCTTPGLEGTACTDNDACVDECEVCS